MLGGTPAPYMVVRLADDGTSVPEAPGVKMLAGS